MDTREWDNICRSVLVCKNATKKLYLGEGLGEGARWAGKTFASGDLRNAAYGEGSETNATYVAFLQTETVTKSKKGKAVFFKRSRN